MRVWLGNLVDQGMEQHLSHTNNQEHLQRDLLQTVHAAGAALMASLGARTGVPGSNQRSPLLHDKGLPVLLGPGRGLTSVPLKSSFAKLHCHIWRNASAASVSMTYISVTSFVQDKHPAAWGRHVLLVQSASLKAQYFPPCPAQQDNSDCVISSRHQNSHTN